MQIEQETDKKVIEGREIFKMKRLSFAMNKLYNFSIAARERNRRNVQIQQYYFDKQAIKIFRMFRAFLDIKREERFKLETALQFRGSNLTSAPFQAWKKYMADNYEMSVKKKAVLKRLRQLKCPIALKQWSKFAELSKVYNQKKQKANSVMNKNLLQKTFFVFKHNKNEQKKTKILFKKAYLYHCECLINKGLKAFKDYKTFSKSVKKKRHILEKVVRKVDKEANMRRLLYSLYQYGKI